MMTMSMQSDRLEQQIENAVGLGKLRADAGANIRRLLSGERTEFYGRVIEELADAGEWSELNDRFFKTLAFGTGGLRGRTIGKIVTATELGTPTALGRPQFPCVGTNAMNYFNVGRATRGLISYIRKWRKQEGTRSAPKIVIAHDTRHFSKEFADLTAKIASDLGCDAVVFAGPRSTPELSFAVRDLNADAGIVITASHNPPHDNGYKVYFDDGAQVVEPHASGIIAEVNSILNENYITAEVRAQIVTVGDEIDLAYMDRLETLILDRELIANARRLKIVYTPLHGTGGVIIKPMLTRLGFNFQVVPEQDCFDGRFPTVKSPNPENAEALTIAINLAQKKGADLVVATDPDCDRMGAAVRGNDEKMKLLTGNQTGSLLAWYRIKTLFDKGVLNEQNASRAVIIKTFVTTDLQKAIADYYGLRCVETLTGFKYIGAKLGKYERAIPGQLRRSYADLNEQETRRLRLAHSSFYVFGGEESYGYSGADFVRDKDGNGAVVMFCEVAAYAKSRGETLEQLLDEIFATFGYFAEKNGSLVFEGAEGAKKITRLAESYSTHPFFDVLRSKVVEIKNFETETIRDVEGDPVPKERMSIFELEDQTRIAVRPSGTEPKIKYYLFAQRRPESGKFNTAELSKIKAQVAEKLDHLWDWLQKDAESRLNK